MSSNAHDSRADQTHEGAFAVRAVSHSSVRSQATGTPDGVISRLAVPMASPGPLAGVIGVVGFLAVVAWFGWRFGPTLARVSGWCSWWVAWACGSQGGYGYCVAFLLLGALAWGGGTVWYARRRGRWPSALSARLFAHLLGKRNPLTNGEIPAVVLAPRRHR
jgi:hypothetical protein